MAGFLLEVDGFCPVCEQQTTFRSRDEWLRDHFLCQSCNAQPRERAMFSVLTQLRPRWRELVIHESSPGLAASRRLADQAPAYVSSQYDPSIPWGTLHPTGGWRSENLERQTFDDESFDLVVTQDVMEHVFSPDLALREIARTLKPGGLHVCTVPIVNKEKPSVRRAGRRADGEIEHLLEPVYHGNPMDPNGSLVTIDWGYDIAAYWDAVSGLSTTIWTIEDLSRGIQAEYIEVLVSRKAGLPDLAGDAAPYPPPAPTPRKGLLGKLFG
ncbi:MULTISPECIES: class I SAM-dependent methyltransferase [unclassified Phenylobacterium]|uniref:class I SAM-dependent methyltransferase n=1 Tax=unclassified Phenylobacterium TaxID=2640670 RepID=UPI0009EC40A6|nr:MULTISPECIES: class I SAM-dependent methyltransferase [unclassified Phenylobacterium]